MSIQAAVQAPAYRALKVKAQALPSADQPPGPPQDSPRTSASAVASAPATAPADAAEREAARAAVEAEFQAWMQLARAQPGGTGPGWVTLPVPRKGDAPAASLVSREGRPKRPSSDTLAVFSPAAFREAYLAQGSAALQRLVQAEGCASVEELLKAHPELCWTTLALGQGQGETEGLIPLFHGETPPPIWSPPYSDQSLLSATPAVQAMMQRSNDAAYALHRQALVAAPLGQHAHAPAGELQAIDALLSAPSSQALLTDSGVSPPSPDALDPAQVEAFGLQRAQVMAMLAQATAGPSPARPSFRGEASVDTTWLARRAELALTLAAAFEAEVKAGGPSGEGRGLSSASLVRGRLWQDFIARSPDAMALAHHLGLADGTALSFAFPAEAGRGVLAQLADPDWRDGPVPAGRAMASAETLGAIDLLLSGEDAQALIQAFGGPPPNPDGPVAQAQAELYGLSRYQAMTQWSAAMQAVRHDYLVQLNNARADAADPAVASTLPFLQHGSFSVEAFTAWYQAQPGASQQAFARLMGPMGSLQLPSPEEAGQTVSVPSFLQSAWDLELVPTGHGNAYYRFQVRDGAAGAPRQPAYTTLDPQAPPALDDNHLVGFDGRWGWITPTQNLHHPTSTTGQILHGVTVGMITGGFAWAGGVVAAAGATGLSTGAAAAAMAEGSLSFTGLVAAGAASGATAAALGAVMGDGSFRWKDVLRGAWSGAFTAGLAAGAQGIAAVRDFASAWPIAYGAALGGSTQALLGESFRQGALSGGVGAVAQAVSASLNQALAQAQHLSPGEIAAARSFIHALDAALRIAGEPGHPSQAFAARFLTSVLNDPALHVQPQVGPAPAAPEAATAGAESESADPSSDVLVAGPGSVALVGMDASSWWARLGREFLQKVLVPIGDVLSVPALMELFFFGAPSNLGPTEQALQLSDDRRFVLRHGEAYGRVETRNAEGRWVPDAAGRTYQLVNTGGSLTPMTDAQLAAYQATLRAPTSVPWSPRPPTTPPSEGTASGGSAAPTPGTAPSPTPVVAPPASAPVPAPAPLAAQPSPAPARPPAAAPAPTAAPGAPAPSNAGAQPTPVPAPMPNLPADAPVPLPGHAEGSTSLPALRPPPLTPDTPDAAASPVIVNPIVVQAPVSPPPSGSTTPVSGPTVMPTPIVVETWDDAILEARPSVDDPRWHYPIRDDFDKHLVNVDSPRGGGGHNERQFLAWVESKGGIYEIQPTDVPGIHEVYALIPRPGNPSEVFEVRKTTYDPAIYSDDQMIRMAREAGNRAWDRYRAGDLGDDRDHPRTKYDVEVDGVRFRAYINNDAAGRPCIGNVHPQ